MRAHPTQTAYLIAKGRCDAAIKAKTVHDRFFDSAYDAAGEPEDFDTFYTEWHARNPDKAAERDRLGALERAAKDALRRAEDAMLAWALPLVMAAATTVDARSAVVEASTTKNHAVRQKMLAAMSQLNQW